MEVLSLHGVDRRSTTISTLLACCFLLEAHIICSKFLTWMDLPLGKRQWRAETLACLLALAATWNEPTGFRFALP